MNSNHHTPPGWGYGETGQPGYGKPFQRPFSHPETQQPAFGGPVNPYVNTGSGAPEKVSRASKRKQQRNTGLRFAIGYLVIIWAVHIISLFSPIPLQYFGIHPLELDGLLYIFTSPLLHGSFEHLISNSLPGALFAYLIGYSGKRVFWEVTMFVVIIGGLGTWVFGGVGTNHIGASGLVYGWLTYLLVRGFFNRSGQQITMGLVLGFMYSGLIWGVLPGTPGVSWQAHLFGAIGGFVAGMVITSDDPPELAARKETKRLEKAQRKQGR
ncbi:MULTISPECIES: rhomboid family intramembrane serine protease [unclassified Corynebacterium]|uniref:rhomboid family intramembrane serine protease n=1 Tax=Corynebacterium sp. Marseille-P4321 TaxID=2736603 RepID=UPI0009E2140D